MEHWSGKIVELSMVDWYAQVLCILKKWETRVVTVTL
jgi:hypothetical protein